MNFLIFGGVNTADYGVYVGHDGIYNTPQRVVETVEVPGRNGLLLRDQGRFDNVTVTYGAYADTDMKERLRALRQALMSQAGYCRLEDTFRPEEFRMARFVGETEVTPSIMGQAATFELTFDCKPQRFLKAGEETLGFQAPGSLYNGGMESLPLIRITGHVNDGAGYPAGNATLTIGGVTVTIQRLAGELTLDCESQDAYSGGTNCNGDITALKFPTLKPGVNRIQWSGNISGLQIVPRWWTV